MKPRRFVSATTFSITCSRGTVDTPTPLTLTLSPEGRGNP
jgi:hypothetical protein